MDGEVALSQRTHVSNRHVPYNFIHRLYLQKLGKIKAVEKLPKFSSLKSDNLEFMSRPGGTYRTKLGTWVKKRSACRGALGRRWRVARGDTMCLSGSEGNGSSPWRPYVPTILSRWHLSSKRQKCTAPPLRTKTISVCLKVIQVDSILMILLRNHYTLVSSKHLRLWVVTRLAPHRGTQAASCAFPLAWRLPSDMDTALKSHLP